MQPRRGLGSVQLLLEVEAVERRSRHGPCFRGDAVALGVAASASSLGRRRPGVAVEVLLGRRRHARGSLAAAQLLIVPNLVTVGSSFVFRRSACRAAAGCPHGRVSGRGAAASHSPAPRAAPASFLKPDDIPGLLRHHLVKGSARRLSLQARLAISLRPGASQAAALAAFSASSALLPLAERLLAGRLGRRPSRRGRAAPGLAWPRNISSWLVYS